MISLKRGRLPAVHNRRTMRSALAMARALDPLGAPPAVSTDYVAAVTAQAPNGWSMYLNDQLGDCVCADSAHELMLHTANAGTIVIPTDQDVLQLYEAVGGYVPSDPSTDQGCDETAMCQYLMTTGLCGQTSAATGMLDATNLDHIRWAVQLFGACRLGIVVGDEMVQQFSSGQPWTVPAVQNPGGHGVPVVKFDADYAYVVTGGGLQPVAWALMAQSAFLEEAHGEVWPDFVAASGMAPSGFNLAALLADLQAIEETS